jgi:hypothetical protein
MGDNGDGMLPHFSEDRLWIAEEIEIRIDIGDHRCLRGMGKNEKWQRGRTSEVVLDNRAILLRAKQVRVRPLKFLERNRPDAREILLGQPAVALLAQAEHPKFGVRVVPSQRLVQG